MNPFTNSIQKKIANEKVYQGLLNWTWLNNIPVKREPVMACLTTGETTIFHAFGYAQVIPVMNTLEFDLINDHVEEGDEFYEKVKFEFNLNQN